MNHWARSYKGQGVRDQVQLLTEWRRAVDAFEQSAYRLNEAWARVNDGEIGSEAYPFDHSFDEMVFPISVWADKVREDMERRLRDPEVGSRVEFKTSVDRYPHALIERGEAGTVVTASRELIAVRLERHHPGLGEWDNEVHFTKNLDNREEFFAACTVLA